MTRVEHGSGWELRLGDWRDVLADVEGVGAVISDPPYLGVARDAGHYTRAGQPRVRCGRPLMDYDAASEGDLRELVEKWAPRSRAWIAVFNDWLGAECMRACLAAMPDRYVAHPAVWVKPRHLVMPAGNNEVVEKACEYIVASRRMGPENALGNGGKPGVYQTRTGEASWQMGIVGGKPLALMRAVVRDYSNPGDLVCDPCAGVATTLLAAVSEGRRAIGAERDPVTFGRAVARLRGGYTTDLFAETGT